MLYLIGLGISDEKGITLKGVEVAKTCDCFIETYTSKWSGDLRNLERMVGKEIKQLRRSDLEDNQKQFLEKCKKNHVALFVLGDPLAATTHADLVLEARSQGIRVEIIHNTSIFSAIGETGLQLYKMGRTATIPYSGKLESVKDAIEGNKKLGLHTLLLLDLDAEMNIYMPVKNALKLLLDNKLVTRSTKMIAGKIGDDIFYKTVSELIEKDIETPSILILPGKLHFKEKEFLEIL
ncbi:MAG: diphthine synthase [Nanoarchaeota archaeon]|nr:diphthine synthase [Nanoarchaeota archaeon]